NGRRKANAGTYDVTVMETLLHFVEAVEDESFVPTKEDTSFDLVVRDDCRGMIGGANGPPHRALLPRIYTTIVKFIPIACEVVAVLPITKETVKPVSDGSVVRVGGVGPGGNLL